MLSSELEDGLYTTGPYFLAKVTATTFLGEAEGHGPPRGGSPSGTI